MGSVTGRPFTIRMVAFCLAGLFGAACGSEPAPSPGWGDEGAGGGSYARGPHGDEDYPQGSANQIRPPSPTFEPAPNPPGPACAGKSRDPYGLTKVATVKSGDRTRRAIVSLPDGYDPDVAAPLVLNFHGFTSDALQQIPITAMSRIAKSRGYVVVYPDGVARSWNAGNCCGTAWTDSVDDIAFTKALIEELQESLCIDPKRVYATGFSNGGFFSYRLACEMADRIAAIAPVSGVMGIDPELCQPARPVPVLHIHGTKDPMVRYDGGIPLTSITLYDAPLYFRSAPNTVNIWRQKNRCLSGQREIFRNGDASCDLFPQCAGDADVVFCTIDGGGHTWPGGDARLPLGKTSMDMSASESILNFFDAHPMR